MVMQYMDVFLLFSSYLIGSVPFGKLVAYSYGIDIQKRGSGNIGFANVRRIIGWRGGLVTLLADIVKGFAPTYIALQLTDANFAFIVGLAAVLGHIFPIWLGFRGGKGIATGLGVIFALFPLAGLIGVLAYVLGSSFFRVSSYSSVFGLVITVLVGAILYTSEFWQFMVLFVMALWTLRRNIMGTVVNYDA